MARTRDQVCILGMPLDIGLYERAARHHRESLRAREVQHTGHQPRAEAAAFQVFWHLGVVNREHMAVALVVGEGDLAVGVEFETMAGGIVADGVGHGHLSCAVVV